MRPLHQLCRLHCIELSIELRILIFTLFLQIYIVSGGWGDSSSSNLASTETLEKDGGSEWQYVASLPSARDSIKGVGLDHGRFIVTGECWTILYILITYQLLILYTCDLAHSLMT